MKSHSPCNCFDNALPRRAVSASWRVVPALLILQLAGGAAGAQNTGTSISTAGRGEAVQIQVLLEEIRAVRGLLLAWRLEIQLERTKTLEDGLESLRGEKTRLQVEQS